MTTASIGITGIASVQMYVSITAVLTTAEIVTVTANRAWKEASLVHVPDLLPPLYSSECYFVVMCLPVPTD